MGDDFLLLESKLEVKAGIILWPFVQRRTRVYAPPSLDGAWMKVRLARGSEFHLDLVRLLLSRRVGTNAGEQILPPPCLGKLTCTALCLGQSAMTRSSGLCVSFESARVPPILEERLGRVRATALSRSCWHLCEARRKSIRRQPTFRIPGGGRELLCGHVGVGIRHWDGAVCCRSPDGEGDG